MSHSALPRLKLRYRPLSPLPLSPPSHLRASPSHLRAPPLTSALRRVRFPRVLPLVLRSVCFTGVFPLSTRSRLCNALSLSQNLLSFPVAHPHSPSPPPALVLSTVPPSSLSSFLLPSFPRTRRPLAEPGPPLPYQPASMQQQHAPSPSSPPASLTPSTTTLLTPSTTTLLTPSTTTLLTPSTTTLLSRLFVSPLPFHLTLLTPCVPPLCISISLILTLSPSSFLSSISLLWLSHSSPPAPPGSAGAPLPFCRLPRHTSFCPRPPAADTTVPLPAAASPCSTRAAASTHPGALCVCCCHASRTASSALSVRTKAVATMGAAPRPPAAARVPGLLSRLARTAIRPQPAQRCVACRPATLPCRPALPPCPATLPLPVGLSCLQYCADIMAAGVALTPFNATHNSDTTFPNATSSDATSSSGGGSNSGNTAGEWGHHMRYRRQDGECWSRAEMACYAEHGRTVHAQSQVQAQAQSQGQAEAERESEALVRKMHEYQRYRRECLRREALQQLRATLLAGNGSECRYLVWQHNPDGQGNRLLSLVSAFALALLSRRILLLARPNGPAALLCEPFSEAGEGPEGSWVLFPGEGVEEEMQAWSLFAEKGVEWSQAWEACQQQQQGQQQEQQGQQEVEQQQGKRDGDGVGGDARRRFLSGLEQPVAPGAPAPAPAPAPPVVPLVIQPSNPPSLPSPLSNASDQLPPPLPPPQLLSVAAAPGDDSSAEAHDAECTVPPILRVDLFHHTPPPALLFFCHAHQRWLARAPTLLLSSNQYFLPALYLLPSFRRALLLLFPTHRPFHSLARLLLVPCNRIWARLTARFHALLGPLPARVGVQGRFLHNWDAQRVRERTLVLGHCAGQALTGLLAGQPGAAAAGGVSRGAEGAAGGATDASSGAGAVSGAGAAGGLAASVMVASLNAHLAHNLSRLLSNHLGHPVHVRGTVEPAGSSSSSQDSTEAGPGATDSSSSPEEVTLSSESGSGSSSREGRAEVEVVQLTEEEQQDNSDERNVDDAIIDLFSLALFSHSLLLSPTSTFGYLIAALAPHTPARFASSSSCPPAPPEPCYHHPPTQDQCPDGQPLLLERAVAAVPHLPLMRCADLSLGLALNTAAAPAHHPGQ
ncbi:unnamed protein product [Closterium sp. Naga37s-1]|nr:unnamed protein product [Closterium sp. Naga37s-1]